ncbi:hypothetical protein K1X76_02970 [bacterium]|nr:hypothetical protein [bacterium]
MNKNQMLNAFKALDSKLKTQAKLLLGGGGAMVLAYDFPLATHDLDALFYQSSITEADVEKEIIEVADELGIPKDWLNSHFQTFLYTLPKNYPTRLKTIYEGPHLKVDALGKEDLLILKCFAGRDKDIPHAKALIKKGADPDIAEAHIKEMAEKNIPKAEEAKEFLTNILDDLGL